MEPRETPLECVAREAFEETGLILDSPLHVLTETVGEGKKTFSLAVFVAAHVMAAPVPSDEVSAWEWVAFEDVGGYRTTPGLVRILADCARHLHVHGEAH